MKKIIVSILSLLFLYSCENICTADKTSYEYNNNQIKTYLTERNGYPNWQCDGGTYSSDEYYFKWIFESKDHGIWATRHAISSTANGRCVMFFNVIEKTKGRFPHDTVFSKTIPCYKLSIRDNSSHNMEELYFSLQKALGDEFLNFFWKVTPSSNLPFIACSDFYLHYIPEIKYLTRQEYIRYEYFHPTMRILEY